MSIDSSKTKDRFKLENFILVLLTLAFSGHILGQQPEQNVNSREIKLNVTVGTSGGFITGLKPDDFLIYDENKQQAITTFTQEDVPLSIGILYDVSTAPNARDKVVDINKVNPMVLGGLRRFIELSNVNNEYFFMTFNDTQNLLSDYSQDAKSVFKAIDQAEKIKAEGGSNLYDAAWQGIEKLSKGKYPKRVLVLLTDGYDSNSKIKLDELENKLKKSDVLLFVFTIIKNINSYYTSGINVNIKIDELATRSGGSFRYSVWNLPMKGSINEKEARGTFASFANELRSQYTIGFNVKEISKQDKAFWHEIKIRVKLPSGLKGAEDAFMRTRRGYYSSIK